VTNPYLSVIIPAYNEEKRLGKTLREMDSYLQKADYDYEILVVNDGSKDGTAELVRRMESEIKNLKLIDNKVNQGKGGVVRDGMLKSTGQIRLFTDADNSTSLDQFEKMRPLFQNGYEVVIGSRAVRGAKLDPPQPLLRRIPGKIGNIIIQLLVLPGIWDTQCGFKAFTAQAAKEVFGNMKTTGWGFDVECLALSRRLGFKIKEVPVRWVNDLNSHVGASAYLQVLIETIRIRLRLWTNAYGIKSKKE
jgi:dolichyl-phosphate beta-glucosyltransferase